MATALERGTESESCRICHASPSDDDDSKEDLIAPCDCSGSMKWVHNSCLVEWFGTNDSANNNTCSTCNGKLHRRPPSYSLPPLPALREIISAILIFIPPVGMPM